MSWTPEYACNDCASLTSGHCWRHPLFSVTQAMIDLTHRHEWRLAGQLADGSALLVCNAHEPPVTHRVAP